MDIFAESAFDFFALRAAAVLGLRFSPFPNATAATVLRYYPSDWPDSFSAALRSSSRCRDEHGASLLMDIYSDNRKHLVNMAADAAFRPSKLQDGFAPGRSVQYRALCMWKWDCLPVLSLSTRADLRFRGWEKYPLRANIRSELAFDDGANMLKGRLDLVHCSDMSYLCFVEAGRRFLFPGGTELSLYMRQGGLSRRCVGGQDILQPARRSRQLQRACDVRTGALDCISGRPEAEGGIAPAPVWEYAAISAQGQSLRSEQGQGRQIRIAAAAER